MGGRGEEKEPLLLLLLPRVVSVSVSEMIKGINSPGEDTGGGGEAGGGRWVGWDGPAFCRSSHEMENN